MATLETNVSATLPAYPAADIAAVLQACLLKAVRARYRRKGLPLPTADHEVVVLVVEIDSMTVVELLSNLDDLLPFKVNESVVKAGGYSSIQEAVKHVTGRVESKWVKHHSGAKV